jgi:hypothetical protein
LPVARPHPAREMLDAIEVERCIRDPRPDHHCLKIRTKN